jgi:ribulose-5-phosphate 4-epimerase/fuculose-1-phosphate aldolase
MSQSIKTKLAIAYRIFAYLRMDDATYTHLSARSMEEDGKSYFIYPFGLLFEEVTPDNLLKVSLQGKILEGQEHQYNQTGYTIHGNIYQARQDVNAVFHLHTPASVAVSALESGLLPLSQWSLHFFEKVAYHFYNSLTLDFEGQGKQLVQDLGNKNVMLLRNHGMLTCGKTLHEALFYAYHLELACKTQIMALSCGQKLIIPDENICRKSVHDLLTFEQDLGLRDWLAWERKISKTCNF